MSSQKCEVYHHQDKPSLRVHEDNHWHSIADASWQKNPIAHYNPHPGANIAKVKPISEKIK